MLSCPACNSENVYFSKKRCCCVCEDCDYEFRKNTKLRLFFSYGHDQHKDLVDLIRKRLEERGHVVWIDHNDIEHNDDWRQEITKGIIGSDDIISFMSKHSLRDPGVCLDEVQIAISIKNERVIRIHLEETKEIKPSTAISSRQYLDMKDWETYYNQGGEVWNEWFNKKMSDLIRCIEDPENAQFDGEITELNHKLNPIDYLTRARILLKDEFRGRTWLLAKYAQWKNSSDYKVFALYGIPGAGKSAFASRLFDEDYDVIACVFFEFSRKDMSDFDKITNVLAFQIACKLPDYREYLLYCINNDSTFLELKGITRFDSYIITPLRNCIVGSRNTQIIVIDSLDEAYDLNNELVVSLLSRIRLLPRWIKVLVTSRYNSAIDLLLDNAVKTHIEKETKDNNSDLKTYLSDHFENFPRINELVDKCEGSFLYASMLCQKANKSNEITEDLLQANGGLDSFYYLDIRRKFNSDSGLDYNKYRPILELLCASDEMPEALLFRILNLDKYDYNSFKNIFADYIIKKESLEYDLDRNNQIISFFHMSFNDWLTNPDNANEFYINEQNGATVLANYLLDNTKINNEQIKDYIWRRYWYNGELISVLIKAELYKDCIDILIDNPNNDRMWRNVKLFPSYIDISSLKDTFVNNCRHEQIKLNKISTEDFGGKWLNFRLLSSKYETLSHLLSDERFQEILIQLLRNDDIEPTSLVVISNIKTRALREILKLYEMGRTLSDCLDQCDIQGYNIPDDIRKKINLYILCSCFSYGHPTIDCIDALRQNKLYHNMNEICSLSDSELGVYDISEDLLIARNEYNTECLIDYLLKNLFKHPHKELNNDNKNHILRLVKYGAEFNTVINLFRDFDRSKLKNIILNEKLNSIISLLTQIQNELPNIK